MFRHRDPVTLALIDEEEAAEQHALEVLLDEDAREVRSAGSVLSHLSPYSRVQWLDCVGSAFVLNSFCPRPQHVLANLLANTIGSGDHTDVVDCLDAVYAVGRGRCK